MHALSTTEDASEKSALSRILREGEVLFAERGFEGVSISELAAAASVSKANVFHHFASKQALYERVLARACETFGDAFERIELHGDGLAERIAALVDWYEDFLRQRPQGTRLILRELAGEGMAPAQVHGLIQRNFERVVGLLEQGRAELRDGIDARLVAKVVMSLCLYGFHTERLASTVALAGPVATDAAGRRQLIALLLRGALRD